MNTDLWVEKYRPTTLDEFVWRDPAQREKVEEWLKEGVLPHLMFSGVQGTGKTSLARLLLRELNIPSGDILEIPASRERKVDEVQDRIQNFVSTWALNDTGFKYVVLDEADAMSPLAQKMLRTDIERFSDVTRFIFTCNYPEKIIPALHSRTQGFAFKTLDRDSFIVRAGEILDREGVSFDVPVLMDFVDKTYPDLRKCINTLSQHCRDGSLTPYVVEQEQSRDYLLEAIGMFAEGNYVAGRKHIVERAQIEEYPDIFRYLYRNLELWGNEDEALLIIRRAVVNHTTVCDPEINLAACLVELIRLLREQ